MKNFRNSLPKGAKTAAAAGFSALWLLGSAAAYALSPSSPKLSVCKNIMTLKCGGCPAPFLMECGSSLTGHLKSDALIQLLKIYFYVDGPEGAEVRTFETEGFRMPPYYNEREHLELMTDKMRRAWPDSRIAAARAVYILDLRETPLYEGTEGSLKIQSRALPKNDAPLMKPRAAEEAEETAFELKEPAPAAEKRELSEEEKKAEQINFAKKHYTGNEDSRCWLDWDLDPIVVSLTGEDQRICAMRALCMNIWEQKKTGFNWLFCKFDSSEGRCPEATQCLKDPHVEGYLDLQSSHIFNPHPITSPVLPAPSALEPVEASKVWNLLRDVVD